MNFFRKKLSFLGLLLCVAVLISGCASSGNGSANESGEIKTDIITENTTEQATENLTENLTEQITESVTHEQKETKPEAPEIMSVTSWSEPDLSDFREVLYPGFELETAVIDGKSYRKFVADNGWYVIDKSKKFWEKDCIIEIGKEGKSKEYPIGNAIGGISLDVLRHDAYSERGGQTAVAPRLFWSDVTGDGHDDICIRIDSATWGQGYDTTCNLYIYDCVNDNFITLSGNSLYETLKNEITISDAVITADGDVSFSVNESGEKQDFTVEVGGDIEDRVLSSCALSSYKQYLIVQDGKISIGNWIDIFLDHESGDITRGRRAEGPLVYKTLEYNAESGTFEPAGKVQLDLIDTYRYADTEDFRSTYWENYIKEHKEQ